MKKYFYSLFLLLLFLIKGNPHLPLLNHLPPPRLIDKVSRIRVLTPTGIYYMRTFFWRQEVFREFAWLFHRGNPAESWGYLSKIHFWPKLGQSSDHTR